MKTLTLLILCLFWANTQANTLWECGERSNLPIEGKSYCAAGDFRLADKKLQKLMHEMMQRFAERFGDSEALLKAQVAFETYREHHCVAETLRIADQPFRPMLVAQCQTRLTNLRYDELQLMSEKLR